MYNYKPIKLYKMSKNQVLTSVKLDVDMFEQFRIAAILSKFSFTKLCERSIHLFLTSPEFKKQILNHNDLKMD